MTVRKSLAQQEEYRVRDMDRSADGDREPRGPVTEAGRRFVREWPDRQTGGPSEYAVGVALAIEAEAALLARPVEPDPAERQRILDIAHRGLICRYYPDICDLHRGEDNFLRCRACHALDLFGLTHLTKGEIKGPRA